MAMTKSDTLNYRGMLFQVGANQTPFVNLISGRSYRSASFAFPMGQTWTPGSASQPSISEDASSTTLTPATITRSEITNTAQIDQKPVSVSFKKQSQNGLMSGLNTNDGNPVVDELVFQQKAQLKKMAIDMEYSFHRGTYAAATNTATAATTRGIEAGTTTNAVNASSARLSKQLMDSAFKLMADNGSPFQDVIIFCNSFQKQLISNIYTYLPMDRNFGGMNIKQIETDFGTVGVIFSPQVSTSVIEIVETSVCAPVFVPVSFVTDGNVGPAPVDMNGVDVLWQPTAITTGARGGFLYSQYGLDYGPETYHGKITSLATS